MKKIALNLLLLCATLFSFAQVSKTVDCTAGTLSTLLTTNEKNTITDLTITGTIDARDFKTMRDSMWVLAVVDMCSAIVTTYTGKLGTTTNSSDITYPANTIPDYAFSNNLSGKPSLIRIINPSTIESIGEYAFTSCKGLSSINIPATVRSIKTEAFEDCKGIDSILIPPSVTSIEFGAFMGCTGLTSISLPTSITSIDWLVFSGCVSLSSITFPSSLTSIGDQSFSFCSSLKTITLPPLLKTIGNFAFTSCTGTTSISIPSSVTSIGEGVFTNCAGMITVDERNTIYSSLAGVLFNEIQTTLIHSPTSLYGDYNIPTTVTSILSNAFYNCRKFNSITIPASVTSIGSWNFIGCSGRIIVDNDNTNFLSLEGVLFDKSIKKLWHCPISVIGSYVAPSTITSIGSEAFYNCDSLTSITLPSIVNFFDFAAFRNCKRLTSFTFPESLNFINGNVFENCIGLRSIFLKTMTPVDIHVSSIFYNVNKSICTLYVPVGSKDNYQTANEWENFTHIIEGNGFWLSTDSVMLRPSNGSFDTITISSNLEWSANSNQTWLTLDTTFGTGNLDIIFRADANPLTYSREATVTFSSFGLDSQTITVIQSAYSPIDFNSTSVSTSQIDLSWRLDENGNAVLVIFSEDNTFGIPVDGINYTSGQTIPGGGIVLFNGIDTLLNHTSLNPSTIYFYKAFSHNSLIYYEGVSCNARTSCAEIESFPYSQDFSSGTIPECWEILDNQGNGQVWKFNNPGGRNINTPSHLNGFAIIDSDDYGSENSQNCDLISPVFNFANFTNISLEFSHYFSYYEPSTATVSYSINNGTNWTFLKNWNDNTNNPENCLFDLTLALKGKKQVLFKWNFIGEYANYWAVDDIKLTAEEIIVPYTMVLSDTTINRSETSCFNALDTITVAGIDSVLFESGSTVDLIAGSAIFLLPGFHAYEGSLVHAYITTDGTFCDGAPGSPVVSQPVEKSVAEEILPDKQGLTPSGKSVKVYPNPNNGQFTLELTNFDGKTEICMYNLLGRMIYRLEETDNVFMKIAMAEIKRGIYFVKVSNGKEQFTKKVIVK